MRKQNRATPRLRVHALNDVLPECVIRTSLRSLAAAQVALDIRAPALLIVGETTRFAERYSWFAPSRIEHYEDAAAEPRTRVG